MFQKAEDAQDTDEMRITVEVTLTVSTQDGSPIEPSKARTAAQQAVRNALVAFEDLGFAHDYDEELAIEMGDVAVRE